MDTVAHRNILTLSLMTLLLVTLAPTATAAGTGEGATPEPGVGAAPVSGEIRLALDAALVGDAFGPAVAESDPATGESLRLAQVSREVAREAWSVRQRAADAEARAAAGGRGFGRWLKRHWWVPVLVGAAVVAVVADDTDRPGED